MADQTVVLTPGTNPTGGFEWQMSLNGGNAQGAPYPSIKVAHGNTAVISFSIQNAPGVTFTDQPFLVPAEAKGIHIDSIQPTILTIKDHNLQKDQIPYVLAFNGAAKLDPIIDNDGGGHFYPTSDQAFVALGGAAVGAILVLLLKPLFSKRGRVERQQPD
jgi:hypothetical protein